MKKSFFLLSIPLVIIIIVILFIVFRDDKVGNIDVAKIDFEYDVDICENYFDLVECVIDKDPDERFTKQMRIDLKNEVIQMKEYWKGLNEDELVRNCNEELDKFKNDVMQEKLRLFGCLEKG